jgi:proteasome lid subunit RPN8/RPN11
MKPSNSSETTAAPPRAFTGLPAGTALVLDPGAEGLLTQDAVEAYPEEACGFLFGRFDHPDAVATEALPVRNRAEALRRRRFAITPEDYRAAERYAERHGLELVGIYHSHPDHPAEPSEHDRAAALPGLSYLILSVRGGRPAERRSWTLNAGRRFDEEPVRHP